MQLQLVFGYYCWRDLCYSLEWEPTYDLEYTWGYIHDKEQPRIKQIEEQQWRVQRTLNAQMKAVQNPLYEAALNE